MLAEEITLVGDIDYDRILGQPLFIEETQQAADIVIDGRSATQVVANQLLIDFPARIFLTHSFYGKGSSGYLHHQESGSFEAIPHRRAISSNGCPGNVRPDSSGPNSIMFAGSGNVTPS